MKRSTSGRERRSVADKPSIQLRLATPDDLSAIVALLEASHLPAWETEQHLANFVVAESDGRVVGCGGLEAYPEASAGVGAFDGGRRVAARPGPRFGNPTLGDGARAVARADELYLFTMGAHDFYLRFDFVDATLDEFPEPVRASGQYQWLSEHRKRLAADRRDGEALAARDDARTIRARRGDARAERCSRARRRPAA